MPKSGNLFDQPMYELYARGTADFSAVGPVKILSLKFQIVGNLLRQLGPSPQQITNIVQILDCARGVALFFNLMRARSPSP